MYLGNIYTNIQYQFINVEKNETIHLKRTVVLNITLKC